MSAAPTIGAHNQQTLRNQAKNEKSNNQSNKQSNNQSNNQRRNQQVPANAKLTLASPFTINQSNVVSQIDSLKALDVISQSLEQTIKQSIRIEPRMNRKRKRAQAKLDQSSNDSITQSSESASQTKPSVLSETGVGQFEGFLPGLTIGYNAVMSACQSPLVSSESPFSLVVVCSCARPASLVDQLIMISQSINQPMFMMHQSISAKQLADCFLDQTSNQSSSESINRKLFSVLVFGIQRGHHQTLLDALLAQSAVPSVPWLPINNQTIKQSIDITPLRVTPMYVNPERTKKKQSQQSINQANKPLSPKSALAAFAAKKATQQIPPIDQSINQSANQTTTEQPKEQPTQSPAVSQPTEQSNTVDQTIKHS